MQLKEITLPINNNTLNVLITELSDSCSNINLLINQLQLSQITDTQKARILAELLTEAIYLHAHCGEKFQELIADEMETLPDQED
ncbi:MAG: hypothetical protein N5P05_001818 [Chroococcopsis gigantea SAG 12.99]|jgi:hypothetical protein|nr:hypothetical protein [Chroococcopsis gigantea SAG 12.99]